MTGRPLVKICGVTRPQDAELAADLGADLVGLNFYPASPRCLEIGRAAEIAGRVRGRVSIVGVFVDRPVAEVERIGNEVGLDLLQFHGDEEPDEISPFGSRAIKVLRLAAVPEPGVVARFAGAWGFLAEGRHEAYGGRGREWPYEWVAGLATARPVLVAGGVGPGNARDALRRSGAAGVDVCSGVESVPGVKCPELLRALFREVGDAQDVQ